MIYCLDTGLASINASVGSSEALALFMPDTLILDCCRASQNILENDKCKWANKSKQLNGTFTNMSWFI